MSIPDLLKTRDSYKNLIIFALYGCREAGGKI